MVDKEQINKCECTCDECGAKCEELKRKVELMMDCPSCKVDEYKEALDEIEAETKINCEEICGRKFEDCNDLLCTSKSILDIINKANGR